MTLTSSLHLFAKPSRMASGLRVPAGWNRRTPDIRGRAAYRLGPTLAPLRAKASSAISQRDEGASIRDWVTVLAASEVHITHCVGRYCLLERDSSTQAISGLGAIKLNRAVCHLEPR
jgi:hypothetical protein